MLLVLLGWLTGMARAEGVSAEALLQAVPDGRVAPGLGVRVGDGGLFAAAEARGYGSEAWLGRGTVGVDLLGGETLDLTLGLFAGFAGNTAGPWLRTSTTDPTWGFELGLGAHIGPARLRYRHLDGLRGPLEDRLSENEFRVGAGFIGGTELFGQLVNFNPGEEVHVYGAGVAVGLDF